MEFFLFLIYITVWFVLTLKRKNLEGFFSVYFVFGLAGFAYFTLIPIELYLKGEEYYFARDWISLGSVERIIILFLSILSLLGFYSGLKTSRYQLFSDKNSLNNTHDRLHKKYLLRAIMILLCVSILCFSALVLFYRDFFAAQYDYTAAYMITYESPLYSFLKMHLLIALALMASVMMRQGCNWGGKLICIAIVSFILWVGILTADKNPLLLALLTCSSFLKFDKISMKRFAIITFVGSISVIFLVLFFNIYRTRMPLEDVVHNLLLRSISFTQLDPAGPMVSLVRAISDDSIQMNFGSTYINSLGVLVPKTLWPDRPLDIAEAFARENISNWSEGQGLGYSPLAEAYVNFSFPGAFIHFFIFGMLIGGFLQFMRVKYFFKYDFLFVPFVHIVIYYIVILSFRAPLIGPIKMLILFLVPYFILYIILKGLSRLMWLRKRFISDMGHNA